MNKSRRAELEKATEKLLEAKTLVEDAQEIIAQVAAEEREAFENLSEGLQASERGQRMDEVASLLDGCDGETDIDILIENIEEAAQ